MAPLANVTPMKPGSAALPFFGIKCEVRNTADGKVLEGAGSGTLTLSGHWPGISRTVLGDHEKYWKTYFSDFNGVYSTGDGCTRDEDGYIYITGRMDDVLKKAGHRIGTAEVWEGVCVGVFFFLFFFLTITFRLSQLFFILLPLLKLQSWGCLMKSRVKPLSFTSSPKPTLMSLLWKSTYMKNCATKCATTWVPLLHLTMWYLPTGFQRREAEK